MNFVLHEQGSAHPPAIRSDRSSKEAFTMIFATTASGVKVSPAVVVHANKV